MQAESGWKAERQLAASLFQQVDSIVIMTDLQGHVQRMNRACEELTGYSISEVRGRLAWSTFAGPKDAEFAQGRLREGLVIAGTSVFDQMLLTKHVPSGPSGGRKACW